MPQRLAVDIGGTFVDAITFDQDEQTINLEKAPTTEEDPTEGVLDSIEKLGLNLEATDTFVHGTTLGINAFLEREGATTGIITNEGFRDVYEIGRTNLERDAMYDITYEKPETLARRRNRIGVPGRLKADGSEKDPLDEDAVEEAASTLLEDRGVESLAICFLHSYANSGHEQQAGAIIQEQFPDATVSLSSDITNEYREYERTSTTVLDGYIKPIFESYVDRLDSKLSDDGFDGEFFITRSGGGALDAENAKTAPVHTILSGPAGGLIGASAVGDATGRQNLTAVDMGGTSLDACVVEDGTPAVEYESKLGHLPVMIPVYDIRTIGAGGGSIAWLDSGLLKVGPKSAGADPGPICYGQGGTEPTLTDAALLLGYLDPDAFLGGEMELDTEAARDGIEQQLASPLDTTLQDVSRGVFDVTLANTVGAIREITVEKGLDPRDFTMVAYGGAGPMFVPLLAREMNVGEVLVPQAPSVFSAWGMLMADVVYDYSQTHIEVLEDVSFEEDLQAEFETLEAEGRATLEDEGFTPDRQSFERSVEMRYFGQEHTVEVPAEGVDGIDKLSERFDEVHQSRYGHTMDDPAQVVHLRVRAVGENDKPVLAREGESTSVEDPHHGTREAYCFATDQLTEFDIYKRGGLSEGDTIDGPCIIEEPTTTIIMQSDQTATIDEFGHIIITGGDGE
ncbi:hydantoinase/oxoprolinase family protein [Halorussus salinisoli]|uniref:hydantoinase/oxoprolinase family protein n=1 Tax=Halorussus salinisoli TaxID=2558242 RepID=UPI0010C173C3|nr:hydantoinase/oxoprolinase family protein [Halorussus salinisoli]